MEDTFDQLGFQIVPSVLSPEQQLKLIDCLGNLDSAGRRGLLRQPEINTLSRSEPILSILRSHCGSELFPVRAIYFDKSPKTNWIVPWHQDLTIAVVGQTDSPDFGPWSIKEGIAHVQPPVSLLNQMITIRLHLDAADHSNGALRILPGTHQLGRLSADDIQRLRRTKQEFLCEVSAGDALLMRPLLLYASSRSTSSRHRRVVHIEYAVGDLPHGLRWYDAA